MKKNNKKMIIFLLIAILLIPSVVFATEDTAEAEKYRLVEIVESEKVENIDTITIDGVTYGKEDGLKMYSLTTIIKQVPIAETRDWNPYHDKTWYMGTSYVQTTEIGYLHYRGRAKAMANVVSGERVIQARITYSRNGSVLKKGISSAKYQSNRWVAGPLKTIHVYDSLNSNAPETVCNYNFVTVNPNVTG